MGKDNLDAFTDNGRRKLVKETIKAPESVLTAMAIGAASVGRPKGHTGSTHNTPHEENSNLVETQWPEGGAEAGPIVNTSEKTSADNMKTEGHRIPTYVSSKMGVFGSYKNQNIGADVTEGPWFAQAADDAENSQLESSMQFTSVTEEVVSETVVGRLVSDFSVSEVRYETLPLNNVVDGEFLGEVVSVSVATEEAVETSNNSAQVESFKFEEIEGDIVLADSSSIVEKLEQMIGQELIASMEGKNVVGKVDAPEENMLIGTPTLDLSKDGIEVGDRETNKSNKDSDSAVGESDEQLEIKQFLTPLPAPAEKVALFEGSVSEADHEGQGTDSLDVKLVLDMDNSMSKTDSDSDDGENDAQLEVKQSLATLLAPVEKVAFLKASASEADHEDQGLGSLDNTEVLNVLDIDTGMNNTDSDFDDGENDAQLEVKQSLTPLPAPVEKVALLEASTSEADHEGQGTDSLDVEEVFSEIDMPSGMNNTDSDSDDGENDAQLEVKQSLTPLPTAPVEKVALLEASASEADHEGQHADSLVVDEVFNVIDMDSGMNNTDSDSDEGENEAQLEVQQSLTPLPAPAEKVALLKASASEADHEGQGRVSLDAEEVFNVIDMDTSVKNTDSDSDESENDAQLEVKQLLTPLPAPVEKVALLEASASEADHEGQGTDSLDVKDHGDTIELLSGVDQTLEKIEAELDDVLDDVSLPVDETQTGNVGDAVSIGLNHSDGVATQTTNEPLIATQTMEEPQMDVSLSLNQMAHHDLGAMAYGSSANASLQSLEEDPREDNKKALESALPALTIGVGTVGTLFGVAGGLQVVGFAALASFLSQEFFWAQSRGELWQEVKGITDRKKLLDFLARRNIVRKDQEQSSL